jgi:hypothetical protein
VTRDATRLAANDAQFRASTTDMENTLLAGRVAEGKQLGATPEDLVVMARRFTVSEDEAARVLRGGLQQVGVDVLDAENEHVSLAQDEVSLVGHFHGVFRAAFRGGFRYWSSVRLFRK